MPSILHSVKLLQVGQLDNHQFILCSDMLEVSASQVFQLKHEKQMQVGQPDNHHAPIDPDEYIRLRLFPVIEFYRSRLPG